MNDKPLSRRRSRLSPALACIALAPWLLLVAAPASADENTQTPPDSSQSPAPPPPPHEAQPYVGLFLVYTGFMFLDSPMISLVEPGIHVQAGMRWSRHISVGIDYSRGTGSTAIGINLATPALQKEIDPLIAEAKAANVIPQNYVAALPLSSITQTITGGPEFPWRRWRRFTPYIRPSCGLIIENATAHPADFLTKLLVQSIAPTGMKNDTTLFYGFGGGVGFNVTKHFGLVVQADLVHDHLFPDLLAHGRNTVRFSIGPGVQFGPNVTRKFILH